MRIVNISCKYWLFWFCKYGNGIKFIFRLGIIIRLFVLFKVNFLSLFFIGIKRRRYSFCRGVSLELRKNLYDKYDFWVFFLFGVLWGLFVKLGGKVRWL